MSNTNDLLLGLLPLIGGSISGYYLFSTGIIKNFDRLKKPTWTPPKQVFGPVWTILYILMGISLVKILSCKNKNKKTALIVFFISLIANVLWAPLFFSGHDNGLLILLIDVLTIISILLFWKIDKQAALLLIPLLCWCIFATFLNWKINYLNK